jgi:hypothetical protein
MRFVERCAAACDLVFMIDRNPPYPPHDAVTLEELYGLLQTIREQASDARVLAEAQARAMIGVVDTIASQWEALADEFERRLRTVGLDAGGDASFER